MFIHSLSRQRDWSTRWTKAAISSALIMGVLIGRDNTVQAQPTPDQTLPHNSTVTPQSQY